MSFYLSKRGYYFTTPLDFLVTKKVKRNLQ